MVGFRRQLLQQGSKLLAKDHQHLPVHLALALGPLEARLRDRQFALRRSRPLTLAWNMLRAPRAECRCPFTRAICAAKRAARHSLSEADASICGTKHEHVNHKSNKRDLRRINVEELDWRQPRAIVIYIGELIRAAHADLWGLPRAQNAATS